MRVFGVTGYKNAGKTSLVERLVAEFVRRGLRVSTIKHAHHAFDVDEPGRDSWRHREAGAHEVLVASRHRWALMHEHRGAPEASLADLLGTLSPADLVLIEGYKRDRHDKIEVWRAGIGHDLIAPDDPTVRAIAADGAVPGAPCPVLDLNDAAAIADFIAAATELSAVSR